MLQALFSCGFGLVVLVGLVAVLAGVGEARFASLGLIVVCLCLLIAI